MKTVKTVTPADKIDLGSHLPPKKLFGNKSRTSFAVASDMEDAQQLLRDSMDMAEFEKMEWNEVLFDEVLGFWISEDDHPNSRCPDNADVYSFEPAEGDEKSDEHAAFWWMSATAGSWMDYWGRGRVAMHKIGDDYDPSANEEDAIRRKMHRYLSVDCSEWGGTLYVTKETDNIDYLLELIQQISVEALEKGHNEGVGINMAIKYATGVEIAAWGEFEG